MSTHSFRLTPVPPFRLDFTVWVLKRRSEYVVDDWDGQTYRRTLTVNDEPVPVSIHQIGPAASPELEISLYGSTIATSGIHEVRHVIERLLGTRIDLSNFYALADEDSRLKPLATPFKGIKPTRYPTIFECLTNAITCQMLSLNVGLRVVSRLVDAYGRRAEDEGFPPAFPTPADIADANPDHLRQIGFSRQKARALIELAQRINSGEIDFSSLHEMDDVQAVSELTAIRGVGRWTAEYTLLRGLGRLHIFPGDDVGARNTLRSWNGDSESFNYERVREVLSPWEPYAGLVYFHMLLVGLEAAGRIITSPTAL